MDRGQGSDDFCAFAIKIDLQTTKHIIPFRRIFDPSGWKLRFSVTKNFWIYSSSSFFPFNEYF